MATYLYCLRSDDHSVPAGLAGIDGAPVRSIHAAQLIAWVSDVDGSSVEVTVERVRAHDAVCAASLLVGETPLPIRFGQAFADDAAVAQGVIARRHALEPRIARLSGCVELRVVVTRGRESGEHAAVLDAEGTGGPVGGETQEGPGTAFLRRLARAGRADIAREVGCEEARQAVRERARDLIVDHQPCQAARGLAFFPVLVRRDDVDQFRGAVSEMLLSHAIDLSLLGPFAPYSFAGDA
ncbi:MAG TPA: GvpL/GvpF family gas vesicle protein [Gemmatimonadaceae bacterium]|nr:GvpL/GvpF family gas vesicle protein [Gemmatimonadaceae bacterium]